MDLESQVISYLVRVALKLWREGPWGGLLALAVIWLQYRRTRYLNEALRRANERRLREQSETWKTALELFANAPPPRLKDLANDTGSDWRLR